MVLKVFKPSGTHLSVCDIKVSMIKQVKGATVRIQREEVGTVFHSRTSPGLYQHLLKMESTLDHDGIFALVPFPVVHISTRQRSAHLSTLAHFEI